ncbi:putative GDSL-like Lipase/Acylhydrolase superfamily protein [Hibiscus syriacus]|uniref:GDSL-like Lipase/Acylhydrolase superfamily protein n=2 Tax=Hibiscus syriacus TaxID=106335 RepID=A0A6A3AS01_HIBSY|nr:putative GDSL-like Lipase/Acylhydrolase superfamily protein [Hibiscus syriacus]
MYGTNGSDCVVKLNEGATLFNERLELLIHQLNTNLPGARFTYLNPSGTPTDLATLVTNSSCCTTGGGGELCLHNSKSCSSPWRYVFWDAVHPTEALNKILAESAYEHLRLTFITLHPNTGR